MSVICTSHFFLLTILLGKCIRCYITKDVLGMSFRITHMLPSVLSHLIHHLCQDENSMWVGTLCVWRGCQKEEVVTCTSSGPLNLNSTAVSCCISQMSEQLDLSAWLSSSSASQTQNLAFDSTLIYPSLPIRQCIWSMLWWYLLLLKVLNSPQIRFHLTLKSSHKNLSAPFHYL